MIDLGTVKPGSTIRIPFTSFDKDDGSAITMTNYAAADILIYKDGGTTERASTAGFTATTDFDAKTGKHLAVIDLADNTTAGFYNAGSEYLVAIDSVTIDAVTTGGWIARFRIGYPDATLDTTIATLSSQTSFTLTTGPAENDALLGCVCLIHDIASAVQSGFGVVSAYTGSTKTVTLTAGVSFTAAAGDNISFFPPVNAKWFAGLATVALPLTPTTAGRTLDVSATGEAGVDWGNVGSPTTTVNLSGTSTKALEPTTAGRTLDVSATGEAGLDWANIGGQTTSVSLTNTTVATVTTATATTTVNGLAAGVVTAASISASALNGKGDWNVGKTGYTLTATTGLGNQTADITGSLSGSVGSVTGAVGSVTGNVGGNVTGSVGSISGVTFPTNFSDLAITVTTGRVTVGTNADKTGYSISGTKTTLDALNDPTTAAIADAVWDEAISGHLGAGSTGEALNAAGAAGDPWTTTLPGAYGAGSAGYIIGNNVNAPIATVDTVVDAIKAKTDSLTFTVAGQVDANIQSINDVAIVGNGSTTPFNV